MSELVGCNVKALFNTLTIGSFDWISEGITHWANNIEADREEEPETAFNTLTIGRFDPISDQITHWANNNIEANREEEPEAARKKTGEEERTRKEEEEKERARKAEEKAHIVREDVELKQQDTPEVEEARLQADEADDVVQTLASAGSGSQDPEDSEQPAGTQRSEPPTPLPTQSSWAKGPPQSSSSAAPSPRLQFPAPTRVASTSHSRRPSALRQSVSITDGVSVSRNNVGSVVRSASVVFGSIDDAEVSSPAAIVAESFGSVPATSPNHVNGASASATGSSGQPSRPSLLSMPSISSTPSSTTATSTASMPKPLRADIAKLFQNPSSPHPQHGPHAAPPLKLGPLPMSLHPAAPQLPHTPTMTHAIPNTPHTPQLSPSISSQPSTPSTANAPRFVTNARGFKVTIKSQDGMELTLDALKNTLQPPTVPTPPASHSLTNRWRPSVSVRIRSEETKHVCEENARREQEKKGHAKNEAIRKKKEEEEGATRNEEDEAAHKRKAEEPNGFRMGTFQSPGSKLTGEERFAMSNSRSASTSSATAQSCAPMASSQGGPGHPVHGSNRTRSKRGKKRSKALMESQQEQGSAIGVVPILGAGFEPVVPLELSASCCVPASTASKVHHDIDPPELIVSKVKALLNKLTTEKFESISDQIIHWANKSVNEKDGRTLIQVIRLVFEMATDEPAWSEMHARLCQKIMERIGPGLRDDGIKNSDDKPIAGGQLFRIYLLNQSQEDFERGWFAKEVTAAAAAAKASDDHATKAAHQKMGMEGAELYFDEYYAAEQVHRQRLGLIKFIGELFKLQMLTERVMHDCVETLLDNAENPEEEEIEILCQLLKTVGELLDTPKAHAHMDVYFTRMKELGKSLSVSPRMQFMLQDVSELRDRRWVGRNVAAAPTTLAAVYEAAAYRLIRISRGRRPMGGEPNEEQGLDSWAVASGSAPLEPPELIDLSQSAKEVTELRDRKWVGHNAVAGGSSVSPAPPKAGDLSAFGKITPMAMVVRPSSIFMAGKKDSRAFSRMNLSSNMFYMLSQNLERAAKASTEALSRTNSSSDMFHMLSQDLEFAAEASTKPSRSSSRWPSVDLGYAGVPEPTAQRRKPRLLPRSVLPAEENATTLSEEQSESPPTVMSEADIKKQIDEDVNEFFAVRNLQEVDVYLADLPHVHRFRLLDKLVASALESKETDARLGFVPMAEILDDIAIDAPTAFDYMAVMLRRCWIQE